MTLDNILEILDLSVHLPVTVIINGKAVSVTGAFVNPSKATIELEVAE